MQLARCLVYNDTFARLYGKALLLRYEVVYAQFALVKANHDVLVFLIVAHFESRSEVVQNNVFGNDTQG